MDDNPYTPPVSATTPEAKPSEPLLRKYALAGLFAFVTWGGLGMTLVIALELLKTHGLVDEVSSSLLIMGTVALGAPCGLLIAWWTWKNPGSKLPCYVANTVGVTPFVLGLLGIFFWGLR